MSFSQIGLGPMRRMIGMGMVEAHDLQSRVPSLTLNAHQFLRSNVIAIVRRVGTGVAATDRFGHGAAIVIESPEQPPQHSCG